VFEKGGECFKPITNKGKGLNKGPLETRGKEKGEPNSPNRLKKRKGEKRGLGGRLQKLYQKAKSRHFEPREGVTGK